MNSKIIERFQSIMGIDEAISGKLFVTNSLVTLQINKAGNN